MNLALTVSFKLISF